MRLSRVAACTAATALLTVGAGLGSASAATDNSVLYTSSTNTGVVQLVLTLPDTIPALAGVPNPLVLTLLGTDAQNVHTSTGTDVGSSRSYLAGGSLVTDSALAGVLGSLNRVLTSDLANPGLKTANLLTVPTNPLGLDLDVAVQKADLSKVTRLATSSSKLTSAQLGSLRSLGLGAVLDPVLAQLNTALTAVTTQTTALGTALSALPTIPPVTLPNPLQPILGGATTITTPAISGTALTDTISTVPAQVNALTAKLLDGAAVKLVGIDTSQGITPAVSSIASLASSKLLSVDLFGGLVTVKATEAVASATAGLTKAAAKTVASPTLLEVKIADSFGTLLQAIASDKGITAHLLAGTLDSVVQPIVTALNAALDTALAQLTSLLSSLNSGISLITQGTVTKSTSANGHQAQAHAVPAAVTIGLPVAPSLVQLSIGKADAVSALSVVAPTVTPVQELPHTGGSEQAALLAMGLILVGGATVVFRRRMQH